MKQHPLRIAQLSLEAAPFAKAGGLGDVAGSLPNALGEVGAETKSFLPKFKSLDLEKYHAEILIRDMSVYLPRGTKVKVTVWRAFFPDTQAPIYFLDLPQYFTGDGIYDHRSPGRNINIPYLVFVKVAMEVMKALDWKPDVIHAHDYHVAMANKWLHTIYKEDPFFKDTASVLTIHNLAFQGVVGWHMTKFLGLVRNDFFVERQYHNYKGINIMAAGIEASDMINTVSPTYAEEILRPEFGMGLERLLRNKKKRLSGILNGVDYNVFDPMHDKALFTHYNHKTIDKKVENKLELQRRFGLPISTDVPLICIVSRLSYQKGLDLVDEAIPDLMDMGAQFIILGSGEHKVEKIFIKAEKDYPQQVAASLEFDAQLAQFIYAGADMLLMPSRYEPMGLAQIIAMRFGTIPIVRKTGGLADTVADGKTGFVFKHYDSQALIWAIRRAVDVWYNHKEVWRAMQLRGMKKDFSWKYSAKKYMTLYRKAIRYHKSGHPEHKPKQRKVPRS
jgi:starch synthase